MKCNNTINLSCVDYNLHNVSNFFYFHSKAIYFKYIISDFTLIKTPIKIINDERNNKKYKYMSFILKIYGFKEVILSYEGSVHSNCWSLTTKGGCKCSYIPKVDVDKSYNKYDKVISITHHWGNSVFHSIIECLTKLGYYLPELFQDASIKIHIMKSVSIKYLHILGFNNSRILYGNIYVKRLLVLEKGSCGSTPPLIHLHSLRYYLRKRIEFKKIYDIILIKRFGKRDIINFDIVYHTLKMIYKENKIVIFYPNTTFSNTLNYFKHAKLVVAPHGAGLSNIIISMNCKIVEFLNKNLCYAGLSKNLGLEYYGIYQNIINGNFFINITIFKIIINNIKL